MPKRLINPLDQPRRTLSERAASFVQQHMYDRYHRIGGTDKEGWVMQWCMAKLEASEGALPMPEAWKPKNVRQAYDESVWQNVSCDSDWPNQET